MKPREFWLCGEPNEYDVGIWYDHHPGVDVVYGKEFHKHHVIEKSAYDELEAKYNFMVASAQQNGQDRDSWQSSHKTLQQAANNRIEELETKLAITVEALKMYASLNGHAMHWPNHDSYSYLQDPAIEALAKITATGEKGVGRE